MKNIVRAFVVVLVLTGVAAFHPHPSATAKTIAASVQSYAMPTPTCEPSDPGALRKYCTRQMRPRFSPHLEKHPKKEFHHEEHRPRFRRRPRPHWSRRLHPHLVGYRQDDRGLGSVECDADPNLRAERSWRLRIALDR